jgi:hypothetical protein
MLAPSCQRFLFSAFKKKVAPLQATGHRSPQ